MKIINKREEYFLEFGEVVEGSLFYFRDTDYYGNDIYLKVYSEDADDVELNAVNLSDAALASVPPNAKIIVCNGELILK